LPSKQLNLPWAATQAFLLEPVARVREAVLRSLLAPLLGLKVATSNWWLAQACKVEV
jgi:hypothetical protein